MKILIAQTDPTARDRIVSLVERGGFDTVWADPRSMFNEASDPESFDLVILDARSLDLDVSEACQKLKARSGGILPVVVLGEGNSTLMKIRALEGGADEYLSVPFDERELLARIRALLRTKAVHDEVRHLAAVQEQIVYTMSHDLQTPLVGIRGAVHNLLRGLVGPLTPNQKEYLEMVGDAARRLSDLTSSMCQSAKRRVGGAPAAHESVDLREVTEVAVAGLRPVIVKKGLRLKVSVEPEVWPARGDRAKLIRVVANLLDNSVKHSPEGGRIEVTIASAEGRPDWVHLVVEDQGPGVPPEEQEQIFSRATGDRIGARGRSKGTGLGLTICRESVEAFGGRIWLESDQGQGARFHVVIPAAAPVRGAT